MNPESLKEHLLIGEFVKVTLSNNSTVEGDLKVLDFDVLIIQTRTSVKIIALSSIISIEKFLFEAPSTLQSFVSPLAQLESESGDNDMGQNVLLEEEELSKEEGISVEEHTFDQFEIIDIPWKEDGYPDEELFKGRNELIEKLIQHYKTVDRTKTFMLYGLTRTGKSSILKYLDANILNEAVKLEKSYRFIPFIWDLSRAASQSNAKDMWTYLLGACTTEKIKKLLKDERVSLPSADILHQKEYRAKHMREIIIFLKKNGYFPIFLIDEFTYYEHLVKSKKVDSSFLQMFRQIAFDKLGCFVYAGAYNLKKMLKNNDYGLTGQFVNIKEVEVNQIALEPARELINVFDKVRFTEGAINQVLKLSNRIPYFIQIICKNVAYYCLENELNEIDEQRLERVIEVLVGDVTTTSKTMVERLSSGTFDNNQYDAANEATSALLATIAYSENGNKEAKGVQYSDITDIWNKNNVKFYSSLKDSLEDLMGRGIIISEMGDNSLHKYKIGVDLFRRWLGNEKSDIELALGKMNNLSYA